MRFREFITEGEVVDLAKIRAARKKEQDDARYAALAQQSDNRKAEFEEDYNQLRDALYELRSRKINLFGWKDTNYAEIISYIDDIGVPVNYSEYPSWYKRLKPNEQISVIKTFGNRENTKKLRSIAHDMGELVLGAITKYTLREPYFSILRPRLNSVKEQVAVLNKLELFATTKANTPLREDHTVQHKISRFVEFACQRIGLETPPDIVLIDSKKHAVKQGSFGGYSLDDKNIKVNIAGRHVADIMRTLAHELVHAHQDRTIDGGLQPEDGVTGSPYENEANSIAGQIMRDYAKKNPAIFESRNATR